MSAFPKFLFPLLVTLRCGDGRGRDGPHDREHQIAHRRGNPATKPILQATRSALDEDSPELLKRLPDVEMTNMSESPREAVLIVNSSQKYQEILGFGGAFSEATALGWKSLTPEDQQKVLHMLFGAPSEGGNGYTMGRVPMGSTDFSTASYNFDNTPGDVDMHSFDHGAEHDEKVGMLPLMREARKLVRARGHTLRLVASPWSPPAWMKLPRGGKRSMLGSAGPNGLDPQYQSAYAKYFSAFISTYQKKGIDIWAVTVQNEPENPAEWEGCLYTPEFMASFIRRYLGPVLKLEQPEVKILVYDHNKDHMVQWAKVMYEDASMHDYVAGMAVHWYGGLNTEHMDIVHKMAPKMLILPTEACNCDGVTYRNDAKKWWQRAEDLALDTMADLNYWANGYVVWNMILNTEGGPNHEGNFCDADIIADPKSTMGLGTIITQASYYLSGHFSRFIEPGSHRIGLTRMVDTKLPPVSASDILYGYLLLESCADLDGNDTDSKAVQTWVYENNSKYNDPDADLSLKALGLCAGIVNSNAADGAVLNVMKCQYGHGEAFRLRKVPHGPRSSFQILNTEVYTNAGFNNSEKCLTSRLARGSDIDMDSGVSVLVVEMYDCLPSVPLNQTFRLVRISDAGECRAGENCRIITGGDVEMCVQPQLLRRPMFTAAAFQAPNGNLSVVALNVGDRSVKYTLHDVHSGFGARHLELPPHSMVSYSWSTRPGMGIPIQMFDSMFEQPVQVSGGQLRSAWPLFVAGSVMLCCAFGGLLGSLALGKARLLNPRESRLSNGDELEVVEESGLLET